MMMRMILAESLANPAGVERSYVRLLRSVSVRCLREIVLCTSNRCEQVKSDDAPVELQRVHALAQLALVEFKDKSTRSALTETCKQLSESM
jgi:hypothetical protein